MAASQAGMKKRQIIANSNKAMFMWIAVASAVIGVCAVVGYFMIQQIAFRDRVARRAEETASILSKNNAAAKELVKEVRKLNTSEVLASAKALPNDYPLQVVLDALPADINALALGSSLQQKIIGPVAGVKIEALKIDGVATANSATTASADGLGTIPFQLSVSVPGDSLSQSALKEVLTRMERSIRTVDIDRLLLETSASRTTITMTAHAYYQPGKTIELTDKVEKP